jgi:hypothetical protein
MAGYSPYKHRPPHRTLGIARSDNGRLWFETESLAFNDAESVPSEIVLYATRDVCKSFLRQGIGSAVRRQGAIVKWEVGARIIHLLPRDIDPSLMDLCAWRDWVESEGAGIGSRSGTAVSMLRARLSEGFETGGMSVPIGLIVGGRMHSTRPAMHESVTVWDLRSAYASTLATLPSGRWRVGRLDLDDKAPQFAECSVLIPKRSKWGPLPQREGVTTTGAWWEEWIIERPYPQGITLSGLWSADELRSAVDCGARILRVHRAWRMHIEAYPFYDWWRAIERGRLLPNAAGSLAKVTGNTLWGVFAVRPGKLERIEYRNGLMHRTPMSDGYSSNRQRDYALAETITARVRARVYDELIRPAGDNLISVCVDGGLVKPGFRPRGDDWRMKDSGSLCAFITPYLFSYRRYNGETVYKAAGIADEKRIEFFASMHRSAFGDSRRPSARRLARALEGSAPVLNAAKSYVEKAFPGSRIVVESSPRKGGSR